MKNYKNKLFKLIKSDGYCEGTFKLSSGKMSKFYIDCRKVTLSSEGAFLSGKVILSAIVALEMMLRKKIHAVGGPTIGADPMVGAVSLLSLTDRKKPIKAFLIRKTAKAHGMQRQIEGPKLNRGDRVVVIDDVATTGGSLIESIKCLRKNGIKVEAVMVLVDRGEGAVEKLKKARCRFLPIFNIKEFHSKNLGSS